MHNIEVDDDVVVVGSEICRCCRRRKRRSVVVVRLVVVLASRGRGGPGLKKTNNMQITSTHHGQHGWTAGLSYNGNLQLLELKQD